MLEYSIHSRYIKAVVHLERAEDSYVGGVSVYLDGFDDKGIVVEKGKNIFFSDKHVGSCLHWECFYEFHETKLIFEYVYDRIDRLTEPLSVCFEKVGYSCILRDMSVRNDEKGYFSACFCELIGDLITKISKSLDIVVSEIKIFCLQKVIWSLIHQVVHKCSESF